MPIKKDNKKRDWAEKIYQKEVDLYKKRLNIWTNVYHWRVYRWYSQKERVQKSELTKSIISTLEKWDYWVLYKYNDKGFANASLKKWKSW